MLDTEGVVSFILRLQQASNTPTENINKKGKVVCGYLFISRLLELKETLRMNLDDTIPLQIRKIEC